MRVLLVEDGLSAYPLPAVRSLAAAGHRVGLGSPPGGRTRRSSAVAEHHHVPPVVDGLDDFLDAVRHAVTAGRYDLVLPGDDLELLALSAARATLGATVPYAPHETVLRAVDKLTLTRAAEGAGLPVPRTAAAGSAEARALPLPVVVKARLHGGADGAGAGREVVRRCDTAGERDAAVRDLRDRRVPALVQEAVDGALSAVTVLCAPGGEVVAEQHQVATAVDRDGRSRRALTVPVDEELSARVATLVGDLGWYGIANLQLLQPRGGERRLIDLNGRFYGSLALAARAGLDLPALWVDLARGRVPAPPPLRARPGVRYQALETELLLARADGRSVVVSAAGALARSVGAAHSTVSLRDPGPALDRLVALTRRRPPS